MSQENVEPTGVVRRAFEAFNRGGPEAMLEFIHPDVEFDDPPDDPDRKIGRKGHADYLESGRKAFEIFDVEWVEPEELIGAGDRVVVGMHAFGRAKMSGIEGHYRRWEVWTVRDGKAITFDFFRTREEALEAVGLRE